MYNFIKKIKDDEKVSIDDILEIENRFGFKMPDILKNYYLTYNGATIYRCVFLVDGYEVEVAKMVELKHSFLPFEKIIEMDRQDGFISSNMIPIARNSGGDYYYWDKQSGKVYLFLSDSIDNPIIICETVEELFALLQKHCQVN